MQCVYYRGDSAHFLLRGQQIMGVVFPSAYLSAGPRDRRHTRPTACETDDMRDRWHAGPTACRTDGMQDRRQTSPRPCGPETTRAYVNNMSISWGFSQRKIHQTNIARLVTVYGSSVYWAVDLID